MIKRKNSSYKSMEFTMNDENHTPNSKKEEFFPFLMDHLPDVFLEKANIELNETDEGRMECLKEIKERIKDDNILRDIEFHNDFLQQFLRHSKYDVDKAFYRLENFLSNRSSNPFFSIISDKMFQKAKSSNVFNVLPRRTPDGCVVLNLKYGNWDPSEVPLVEMNAFVLGILQQCIRDPMTQINGLICIYDWKNASFKTIRQFTPTYMYQAIRAYLNCIPIRYKQIHVVNHYGAVKLVWSIIKPLLSEKIKNRMVFHSNPEDLCDYMPLSVIPVAYGGDLKEELYESKISNWVTNAYEQQKQFPQGGQSNYY